MYTYHVRPGNKADKPFIEFDSESDDEAFVVALRAVIRDAGLKPVTKDQMPEYSLTLFETKEGGFEIVNDEWCTVSIHSKSGPGIISFVDQLLSSSHRFARVGTGACDSQSQIKPGDQREAKAPSSKADVPDFTQAHRISYKHHFVCLFFPGLILLTYLVCLFIVSSDVWWVLSLVFLPAIPATYLTVWLLFGRYTIAITRQGMLFNDQLVIWDRVSSVKVIRGRETHIQIGLIGERFKRRALSGYYGADIGKAIRIASGGRIKVTVFPPPEDDDGLFRV